MKAILLTSVAPYNWLECSGLSSGGSENPRVTIYPHGIQSCGAEPT